MSSTNGTYLGTATRRFSDGTEEGEDTLLGAALAYHDAARAAKLSGAGNHAERRALKAVALQRALALRRAADEAVRELMR